MRWEDLDQQPCSLARTLAVVGDRWTLLILRDCFLGPYAKNTGSAKKDWSSTP